MVDAANPTAPSPATALDANEKSTPSPDQGQSATAEGVGAAPTGDRWIKIDAPPQNGVAVSNAALEKALEGGKLVFGPDELKQFEFNQDGGSLVAQSYVKAGDHYFRPLGVTEVEEISSALAPRSPRPSPTPRLLPTPPPICSRAPPICSRAPRPFSRGHQCDP